MKKVECGASYVGQSGRHMGTRLKEHRKAVEKNQVEKSALAKHIHDFPTHNIVWDNFIILDSCDHLKKRIFMEKCHIARRGPQVVNKQTDIDGFPDVYLHVL